MPMSKTNDVFINFLFNGFSTFNLHTRYLQFVLPNYEQKGILNFIDETNLYKNPV